MSIRGRLFTSSVLILCLFHISLFRESVASLRIVSICFDGQFQCENKKCVQASDVCDTFNDCGDMSDEKDCRVCHSFEFSCFNGRCISYGKVCDKKDDCGDGSDELNCNLRCRNDEFLCKNQKCIKKFLECDGKNDCGDMSDEQHCYKSCFLTEFECRNSKCISRNKVCNRINDCGDNSDEIYCGWKDDPDYEKFESRQISLRLTVPLILSSVALVGVVLVVVVFSIACCVVTRKKNKPPTNSSSSELQQPQPPTSIIGRMRQSFRTLRHPTAPPLEIVSTAERAPPEFQTPSVIDSTGQSSRSIAQPTYEPANATPASDLRSENTQVPPTTIYPHLPLTQNFRGIHNPEFKVDE